MHRPLVMAKPKISFFRLKLTIHRVALLAFPLMGVLLYAHTLDVPFYLDDFINVGDKLYAMKAPSPGEMLRAATEGFAPRRPLANLSFALNYFFHGLRFPGYHLVNMGIHIVNGLLLYLLIFKTITLPGQQQMCRYPAWVALLSALLWFVNPVQTQAVTYLVQRMTSMAGLFCLCAFILYVYGRLGRRGTPQAMLLGGAVLCWILAVASKEIAFVLPGLVYVYEWMFFRDLSTRWLKKSGVFLLIGAAGLVAAVYFMYHYTPVTFFTKVYQHRNFTALERFLTESRVLFLYMSLLLWPHPGRLNLNHDITLSRGLLEPPTTLFSFLGLFALMVLTVLLLKRYRLIAFALIWFFANVAIEALAADIEIMFEHRVYLPSMFFFLPLVWWIFRKEKRFIALTGAAAAIMVFSLWTYQRNALWKVPVSFWQDAVAKSPHHYRGYANLGVSSLQVKAYEQARQALEKALRLAPPYPTEIYVNLGLVQLEQGEFGPARENLERALTLNRNNYVALDLLGTVSRREKKYIEALGWYEKALAVNPGFASAYYNLATLQKEMGHADKAFKTLHQALVLRPMWSKGYSTLGLMHVEQKQYDLAEAALLKATAADPNNTRALFNLAKLYEITARPAEAARTYKKILETAPEDVGAMHNLGLIYITVLGDMARGKAYLSMALKQNPRYDHAALARRLLSGNHEEP